VHLQACTGFPCGKALKYLDKGCYTLRTPAMSLVESKSLSAQPSQASVLQNAVSFGRDKFVQNIYGNTNSPQVDNLFFPNLCKLHNLYILMNFYLVLLKSCKTNLR
jgi:hypothetical protein